MAKQQTHLTLSGEINGVSYYKSKLDGFLVRAKGGVSGLLLLVGVDYYQLSTNGKFNELNNRAFNALKIVEVDGGA